MLSKILRFFAQDQEAVVKEAVQHTTSSLQETPKLLDKRNIGLIILDSDDCILYINSVSSLDLNIPKHYLGTKFVEVFNNGEIINLIKNAKVDSSAEEEIFGVDPGNKSFLVNATYENESFETTLVFIDITRIKKLENIRKDFIANLSHELRTPVAVIRANSESLVDGALNDKEIDDCDFVILPSSIIAHETELEALNQLKTKKIFVTGIFATTKKDKYLTCLLYTSPSPRD